MENSDQLHQLTALGCDEVQGFYLAKPMPADTLAVNLGGVHGRRLGKLAVTEWFDNAAPTTAWPEPMLVPKSFPQNLTPVPGPLARG